MERRVCSVDGCEKPARSLSAEWCKMHYHRWYRHGDPHRVATDTLVTASHGRRYRSVYLPRHPLAGRGGKVYAHRAALYDKIGCGPHPCHWCAELVDWHPRGHPDELHSDHLNGVGDDNRPENLVPSCRGCNVTRALQARSEALRAAGWWSHNDTVAALRATGRRAAITAAVEEVA
jgi:hypothetical protein